MQELKLADDLMRLAHDGQKRITIRKGPRPIALGPLILRAVGDEKNYIEVDVWSAFKLPFGDIPLKDINADGAANHVDMLRAMQGFYPDMEMHTECTVVCWR